MAKDNQKQRIHCNHNYLFNRYSCSNDAGYSIDETTQDYGEKMPSPIARSEFVKAMRSIGYEKFSEEEDGNQGKYATYYKPSDEDDTMYEMSDKQLPRYMAESTIDTDESGGPFRDFNWDSDYNKHAACSKVNTHQCMISVHVKNTLISIISFDESVTEEILNAVNYW